MYRAPEMVDTWNNYVIGPACDVWAIGCLVYTFCFMKHPFDDSAKLRILNANYTIPANDTKYTDFHPIIRGCLQVDPTKRFSIHDVLERLAAIAETRGYNVKEPLALQRAAKPMDTSENNGAQRTPESNPLFAIKVQVAYQDGKASSGVLVCAFLMFVGFVKLPEQAAQMFAVKRCPPGFQPSEIR
ncbi:cyclin-G-associated kinase-like [Diaphorina citri]|uniref:Cyclin-G-associated kinase-like n=1 Tax=Diaphorina citri TaxID=121845 RepID=A0A1S3DNB9_DIACI|nr:cyclin-G-associated kinase-like [Diaphorina citri]